jgi:4-amino-4-deoxy-L-arabinose transferase-like glycosyltransferase
MAAIAAIAIIIRIPFLFWPLTGDEGNYAYTAFWWARGHNLYADFLGIEKPQGVFLSYWLSQRLFGLDTWTIRFWGALWAAGTSVAVYITGKKMANRSVAIIAGVLFAIYSSVPQVEGFTTNAEIFMVLPLVLCALALWEDQPFWAGFWASFAMVFKISGISGLMLASIWLFYRRAPARTWMRLIAGAFLPLALALAHGAMTVGLETYLNNIALFRMGVGWQYVVNPANSFRSGGLQTAVVWLPLGFLAVVGIIRQHSGHRVFTLSWTLVSLIGVAMGGDWNLHYFVQLIPALCIPAAVGLSFLGQARKPIVRLLTLALVALSIVWMIPSYWKPPLDGSWELYHRVGIQIGDDAGAYIQAHTEESDSIYVAYFQANIYYQARRRAVVPFLSRVQLLYLPGAYDRLVSAIEDREPVYVLVLGQTLDGYDAGRRFQSALVAGYRVEETFAETTLYRRVEENSATDAGH